MPTRSALQNPYDGTSANITTSKKCVTVKGSYWRWPQRNLAGNAIDFFVQVLGLSFHDAMRQICGP
jgi:hypothetical protein